jgi:hypothetical protein
VRGGGILAQRRERKIMDMTLDCATILLAFATVVLAFFTWRLAVESREASQRQIATWEKNTHEQIGAWEKNAKDQIGIQTWLALEARFDSIEMHRARGALAENLRKSFTNPAFLNMISDTVLDFFESVSTAYNLGYLNKELADSSFSFYAMHWWEAANDYIGKLRDRHGKDKSLYCEFETFASEIRARYGKIDQPALLRFLMGEEKLLQM